MIAKVVSAEKESPKGPLMKYEFILGDEFTDEQETGTCTGYSVGEVYDRLERAFPDMKVVDLVCRGRDVQYGMETIYLDEEPIEAEGNEDESVAPVEAGPKPEKEAPGLTFIPFHLLMPDLLGS